jgi:hypothetical protein
MAFGKPLDTVRITFGLPPPDFGISPPPDFGIRVECMSTASLWIAMFIPAFSPCQEKHISTRGEARQKDRFDIAINCMIGSVALHDLKLRITRNASE